MRRAPTLSPAARLPRGAVSWVSLFLLVVVVGGSYLAFTWGPVYVLHFEARQVVRDYMNRAIKDPSDAALLEGMLRQLRALDQQEVPDESGKLVKVPTIQVDPKAVTWVRDNATVPPSLHVSFEYTRDVPYPLLKRWTEKTLAIDFTEELSRTDWGPSR